MSMVVKKVQIEFASPKIQAKDAINDLKEAAVKVGMRLYIQDTIQLQSPMVIDGKVIVEIRIPKDMVKSFSYGHRLRGLSAYLLKYCNGRYDQYQVGNRLLNYKEVSEESLHSKELSTTDQFEAISEFARLMERTDEESKNKVTRIMKILEEGR